MTVAMSVLLIVAVLLANGPFLTGKWFGIKTLPQKRFRHHLSELVAGYVVTGMLAYWFESQSGPVHAKDWEFYTVTAALYLVFAFPAFVWRYFWHSKNSQ